MMGQMAVIRNATYQDKGEHQARRHLPPARARARNEVVHLFARACFAYQVPPQK